MNELKFLIVLVYYKRPKIVLNALDSIKNLKYNNWELSFIDDSGHDEFKNTLFNFGLDNSKIKYTAIYDTDEQKTKQGGSRHGHFINESIKNSDADFTTILCDDDALVDDSFNKLNVFFQQNPNLNWCYNKVYFYDPTKEFYKNSNFKTEVKTNYRSFYDLNNYYEPINPQNKVDGSQVIYKNKIFKENKVFYPFPQTMNLDSAILKQLNMHYGLCWPSYIYSQYKGVFGDQMGNRNCQFYINDA